MGPVDWGRLIALSLVWGLSFLFIKVALEAFTPLGVAAGRIVFGALTLIVLLRFAALPLPGRGDWNALALAAALNSVAPWILLAAAEKSISSGMASILNATTPLFTVIVAVAAREERFHWMRLAGVAIGLAGVALLTTAAADVGAAGFGAGQGAAFAMVLTASACYAVGATYARRRLGHLDSRQMATSQLVAALILIAPLLLFTPTTVGHVGREAIGPFSALLALGVMGTGIAYVMYFRLLMDVGPSRTVVVTYLVPVTAVAWGSILLDETVTVSTLAAMAVILVGTVLVSRSPT